MKLPQSIRGIEGYIGFRLKEFELCYHNGYMYMYIYMVNKRVSPIYQLHLSSLNPYIPPVSISCSIFFSL